MDHKIAVIGLGYVGLPLARLLSTKYPTIGFDINTARIAELMAGMDTTQEVSAHLLKEAIEKHDLFCTDDINDLKDRNVYIVTTPTPTDQNNRPDLTALIKASETVGLVIKKGDLVIYESTVYPGATEEDCVPVIEKVSGLRFNEDFFAGYSPERINPGDKEHTVGQIKKITSGSTSAIAKIVDQIYASIIEAGTYPAPSIRIAEAAKVIENTQRDINIAFINELTRIFDLMDIDTHEVLKAAGTKWNFLRFTPGLVGGHCIGVAPLYLAQKAQAYGYHPDMIMNARRINDSMGEYVASQVVKRMSKAGQLIQGANVLILGFTFKENCPDIRNTKVADVVQSLRSYDINVTIYDPWICPETVKSQYNLEAIHELSGDNRFDALVLTVAHDVFKTLDIASLTKENGIVYDLKGVLRDQATQHRF